MLGKIFIAAAAATAGLAALPSAASAHDPYYDRGGYYDDDYDDGYYDRGHRGRGYYDRGYRGRGYGYGRRYRGDRYVRRCSSGTTGAIVGGAAGALLGREIGRSGRRGYYRRGSGTRGAIVGGTVGALIGQDIDSRC